MKYLLPAIFTFFSVTTQAQPVTFMTYNIRLDVASDGENAWPRRSDYLAAQVRFYAPDVWGIQEGLPHQVAFLQEKFWDYGSLGMGREPDGKGESTHVFFKAERFEAEKSQVFWLSPFPDSVSMGWDAACRRVCTALRLKDKNSGKRFWVFNTHFDHMGEMARVKSAELILSKIKAVNPENLPVVLMGDFNAEPGSAPIAELSGTLNDTRNISKQPAFGPTGTFNGFRFEAPVSRRIDYIFVSRTPAVAVRRHAVLSDSKDLRYPSDHLPVWAELEFF
ncbi:MAG: endonuclease/exonuclease/phosphatase family protein [Saprospiraceae bacterium]|nr:endonuclease/exonuclease/phosphatase family protein [Saprospiraceae bacterium]